MDMVKITPSPLCGKINIPPSKSFAHRAIISAFLSGKPCKISNLCLSNDIYATMDCISALGGRIEYDKSTKSAIISKGELIKSDILRLDCNESGSTLRFFIPIALCLAEKVEFSGSERLMHRPLEPYFDIFQKNGISYSQKDGVLSLCGKLRSGEFVIDGSVSSQFISGLLFALPCLNGNSRIIIKGSLSSRAYIDITLDVLNSFGIKIKNDAYKAFIIEGNQNYKACDYRIEGDFSQAAFFLVAGALGCDISCHGLLGNSLQGDKAILDIITQVGAQIQASNDNCYKATPSADMYGVTIDADAIPDLVPILAVLLAFCKGESRIINAGRLRLKESDRLYSITTELKKMGADITEGNDFLIIRGKQTLNGAIVSSHNDHRIAMALSVAACRTKGTVTIIGAKKAVAKSYPNFFDDYKTLGGILE